MDRTTQSYFVDLHATDKVLQYEAFNQIMAATQEKVGWAYEVWDQLLNDLKDSNNHTRSRAAQFLCNLAISDPENRIMKDFPAVWEVTFDKKFVTARHSLQSIWKIGLAGEEQKKMVINQLVNRYINCLTEKNYTLIRFDIVQDLRNLYDAINDVAIKEIAFELITKEEDPKYKKKYAAVWKNV